MRPGGFVRAGTFLGAAPVLPGPEKVPEKRRHFDENEDDSSEQHEVDDRVCDLEETRDVEDGELTHDVLRPGGGGPPEGGPPVWR